MFQKLTRICPFYALPVIWFLLEVASAVPAGPTAAVPPFGSHVEAGEDSLGYLPHALTTPSYSVTPNASVMADWDKDAYTRNSADNISSTSSPFPMATTGNHTSLSSNTTWGSRADWVNEIDWKTFVDYGFDWNSMSVYALMIPGLLVLVATVIGLAFCLYITPNNS